MCEARLSSTRFFFHHVVRAVRTQWVAKGGLKRSGGNDAKIVIRKLVAFQVVTSINISVAEGGNF